MIDDVTADETARNRIQSIDTAHGLTTAHRCALCDIDRCNESLEETASADSVCIGKTSVLSLDRTLLASQSGPFVNYEERRHRGWYTALGRTARREISDIIDVNDTDNYTMSHDTDDTNVIYRQQTVMNNN